MKIILKQDVKGKGKKGQMIEAALAVIFTWQACFKMIPPTR